MANIITKLTRPVRRRLKKIAQYNKDADYRRRSKAILLLQSNHTLSSTANMLCASRTSINKWLLLFQEYGESGLVPEQKGRATYNVNESICIHLLELVKLTPKEFGWFASRWSSELLASQVNEEFKIKIHASTIRRLLPKLGVVWNRASPTLCIQDKEKAKKMKRITQRLWTESP